MNTYLSSLTPLDIILTEICAFFIGFNYTAWTKMRSMAGLLADGVLADTTLIPPPTDIRKARGHLRLRILDVPVSVLVLHPYITASRTSS